MKMAAILFFANLRIKIQNSSPVNKFFEISTIRLSLITCQIYFNMKCLEQSKKKKNCGHFVCCHFEDQDPIITHGKQFFFEISSLRLPVITCQIYFNMKCLERRAKIKKMAAILFCCQFEDQDPKITLGNNFFEISSLTMSLL